MWTARISDNLGKLFDYKLSPKFKTIEECQKYIDQNLKEIETELQNAFKQILEKHFEQTGKYILTFGNFIRCYNVEQKRFCTGFDF